LLALGLQVLYPQMEYAYVIIFVFMIFVLGNFVDMLALISYKYGSFAGVVQ
jgi:hypothetical protein